MAATVTNTSNNQQIPDNSILDINGKQTYLGNAFILPTPEVVLEDSDEHPIVLITNPATSKKSLFLYSRKATSDSETFIRYYSNPVAAADGSATTALNCRPACATASVSLCYLSPTITSNGTFIAVLGSQVLIETVSNVLFVLDPGQSLLITATANGATSDNPATIFTENVWYELIF